MALLSTHRNFSKSSGRSFGAGHRDWGAHNQADRRLQKTKKGQGQEETDDLSLAFYIKVSHDYPLAGEHQN